MGIAERRDRERETVRTLIVEAARDILSERGLDGLSMRSIAERIEYSPATLYLYFQDKEELIREVIGSGFERLGEYMAEELRGAGEPRSPVSEYAALGKAYARFALENTAYFRVMFELPSVPQLECPSADLAPRREDHSFDHVVETLRQAAAGGWLTIPDPARAALIGWSLMHGLTSLYLSGHFKGFISTHEEFFELVTNAQQSLYTGWRPDGRAGVRESGEGASVLTS